MMAWQWAETLVEIRGTTKLGIRYHFPKHEFNGFFSGVPNLWDRNKILRGGDLSHLHVPDYIWVFLYFVYSSQYLFLFWIVYLL